MGRMNGSVYMPEVNPNRIFILNRVLFKLKINV